MTPIPPTPPPDGGPAFLEIKSKERLGAGGTSYAELNSKGGMTLRDYFAAKSIQTCAMIDVLSKSIDYDDTAEAAYKMADAMLKARKQ